MSYYGKLTPLADIKKGKTRGKLDINKEGVILLQLWPGQTLDEEVIRVHLADFPTFKVTAVNSAATTLYETEGGERSVMSLKSYAAEELTDLVDFLERVRSGKL